MAKDFEMKPNPQAVKLMRGISEADSKQFSELALIYSKDICPVAEVLGGTLKNSLVAEKESPTMFVLKTRTGYGAHVHFGTKNMQARPFFAQGTDKATPEMARIIGSRSKYRK
jgi:hypothetical protein